MSGWTTCRGAPVGCVALVLWACAAPAPPSPVASAPSPERLLSSPVMPALDHVERVLGGARADQALPMVIAVHGLGDTPEHFAELFERLGEPVRLIAPRGPYAWGDGAAWSTVLLSDRDPQALHAQLADVGAQVAQLAQVLAAQRPTLGKPVITGFSQGGMVSFVVAAHHPDAIAGAVPLAGWLPPSLVPNAAPPSAVPIRALHGAVDDRLPVADTRASVAALRAAGFDVELKEYAGVAHHLSAPMVDDLRAQLRALRAP